MPIAVACPSCGSKLRAHENMAESQGQVLQVGFAPTFPRLLSSKVGKGRCCRGTQRSLPLVPKSGAFWRWIMGTVATMVMAILLVAFCQAQEETKKGVATGIGKPDQKSK